MLYFKRVGRLTSVEKEVPFNIKRVYWIVTRGESRGNHAHKMLKQVIACVQGSFILKVDNGKEIKSYDLCGWNPQGVYVSKEWLNMTNCSEDCIILVFASDLYHELDYIRDKKEWQTWIQTNPTKN